VTTRQAPNDLRTLVFTLNGLQAQLEAQLGSLEASYDSLESYLHTSDQDALTALAEHLQAFMSRNYAINHRLRHAGGALNDFRRAALQGEAVG
jgi:hypothetical protein